MPGGKRFACRSSHCTAIAERAAGRVTTKPPHPSRPSYCTKVLLKSLRKRGIPTETGRFRAMMDVELVNDGPVTLLLDSDRVF